MDFESSHQIESSPQEQGFICEDRAGRRMSGILTLPPGRGNGVGLVLLNAGLLPRYGYHRHYVKGARRLAARGFTVLRIDLPGLGDSEGELADGPIEERWREIQLGALAEAAVDAAAILARRTKVERVALAGACGGAITALLAAARAPERIAACVAISLPVCLSGSLQRGIARARHRQQRRLVPAPGAATSRPDPASPQWNRRPELTAASERADAAGGALHPLQAELLVGQYVRKLGSPAAWRRLLTGKSSLSVLWEASVSVLGRKLGRLRERLLCGRAPAIPDDGRLNPRFLPAYTRLVRNGTPLLVVLGELDPDADDFRHYFERPVLEREPALRRGVTIRRFPAADHTFAHPEDERLLWSQVGQWLRATLLESPLAEAGEEAPAASGAAAADAS